MWAWMQLLVRIPGDVELTGRPIKLLAPCSIVLNATRARTAYYQETIGVLGNHSELARSILKFRLNPMLEFCFNVWRGELVNPIVLVRCVHLCLLLTSCTCCLLSCLGKVIMRTSRCNKCSKLSTLPLSVCVSLEICGRLAFTSTYYVIGLFSLTIKLCISNIGSISTV